MLSDDVSGAVMLGAIDVSIAGGLYLARSLVSRLESQVWFSYCQREANRNYRRIWRRELLDFLDRSQLNFHLATRMIAHTANEDELDTRVAHFMQQDYASGDLREVLDGSWCRSQNRTST